MTSRPSTTVVAALCLVAGGAAAQTEDLPCDNNEVGDVWTFSAPTDAEVMILVDTVDAATAFDPAMDVIPAGGPPWEVHSSTTLGGGDDEVNCTFPPPDFACPAWGGDVVAGDYSFIVYNMETCAGVIGNYSVRVLVCGVEVTPTLAADDTVVAFITDGTSTPLVTGELCPNAAPPQPTDAGPSPNDPPVATDAGPPSETDAGDDQTPAPDGDGLPELASGCSASASSGSPLMLLGLGVLVLRGRRRRQRS